MAVAHQIKVCPTCKGDYAGGEIFCPVDATRLLTSSQLGGARVDPNDPLIGALLAQRYEVIKLIGEGGMGLVYEGLHKDIDKRVAIKVLRDDLSKRADVVERFRQEAKSASRIGHEHIVDVSDFGETVFGASYFVMEFLDGADLADVLAAEGVIEPERLGNIVLQCCNALGATHEKHIIHRDMKPENVFLTRREGEQDFVKIVDFGIAMMSDIETEGAPGRKLTKTGMIFGTPEYMSPEQAAGQTLDYRVDIYATGVIMYECLAGQVPFVGDTFMGILTKHLFDDPPRIREVNPDANVSPEMEMVIRKALAKDPSHRYQNMAELAEATELALQGKVSDATQSLFPAWSEAPAPSEPTFIRKRPWGRWLLFAALLGAALVGVMWSQRPAPVFEAPPPEDSVRVEAVAVAPPAPRPESITGLVRVRVETTPPGATLKFASGKIACDSTPCTLEVPSGERISLRASSGRMRGRSDEIVPEGPVTVSIRLRERSTARARKRAEPAKPQATPRKSRPKQAGDLKVPDIFR